jgi:hypothetical protein
MLQTNGLHRPVNGCLRCFATAGFQIGALNAVELTNIRLVTWQEFQSEFEASWIKNYMMPTIVHRLDKVFSYTEPIPPFRLLEQLTEEAQRAFMELRENHQYFWPLLFTMFSPYLRLPTPPLSEFGRHGLGSHASLQVFEL